MPITRSKAKTLDKGLVTSSEKEVSTQGQNSDTAVRSNQLEAIGGQEDSNQDVEVGRRVDKVAREVYEPGEVVEGGQDGNDQEEAANPDIQLPPSMVQVECDEGLSLSLFYALANLELQGRMTKIPVCIRGHVVHNGGHYMRKDLILPNQEPSEKSNPDHEMMVTEPIIKIRDLPTLSQISLENIDEEQCIMSVKPIPKHKQCLTSSYVRNMKPSDIPAHQSEKMRIIPTDSTYWGAEKDSYQSSSVSERSSHSHTEKIELSGDSESLKSFPEEEDIHLAESKDSSPIFRKKSIHKQSTKNPVSSDESLKDLPSPQCTKQAEEDTNLSDSTEFSPVFKKRIIQKQSSKNPVSSDGSSSEPPATPHIQQADIRSFYFLVEWFLKCIIFLLGISNYPNTTRPLQRRLIRMRTKQ